MNILYILMGFWLFLLGALLGLLLAKKLEAHFFNKTTKLYDLLKQEHRAAIAANLYEFRETIEQEILNAQNSIFEFEEQLANTNNNQPDSSDEENYYIDLINSKSKDDDDILH